jgi:hypothetical protein
MRIEGVRVAERAGCYELSALIGGLRVWYLVDAPPVERVEPFVPAALLAAMANGEPLEMSEGSPVSPRLLEGIERAQEMLHVWNPELRRVPIRAGRSPASLHRPEIATLFSCGVDSLYTLQKHLNQISLLLLIQGLDIPLDNPEVFDSARASAESLAQETGHHVITIRTNLRDLAGVHRLSLSLVHGVLLAGVALAVGCSKTYLPASFTYAHLMPWGTHPMLDPLWSTESCELVHDGAEARRTDKVAALAQWEAALRILRVCFSSRQHYNCGRCEKCLRTMVSLYLVGARSPTFPPLPPVAVLRKAPADPMAICMEENLELAERVGDREIARALRSNLQRRRLKRLVWDADTLLLGGRLKRFVKWVRRASPQPVEIDVVPRQG